MEIRFQQLEQRMQQAELRFQQAETAILAAQRRARWMSGLALVTLLGCVATGIRPVAHAQGYGVTLQTLVFRIAAINTTLTALESTVRGHTTSIDTLQTATQTLQAKTQYQSVSGTDTLFSGTNVCIQNGLGATNGNPHNSSSFTEIATNGLGNLIIGYNATGHWDSINGFRVFQDIRTGSHNLILGDWENYSSYGGLIAGQNNTISGPFACISGGRFNTASRDGASISGGFGNAVSGEFSSISGGQALTLSDSFAWSGGSFHSP